MTSASADAGPARLLISCPDRHGIVAGVSQFLFEEGANILEADQHSTEPEGGEFFMRMAFRLESVQERGDERVQFAQRFAERVAEPFGMSWRFAYPDDAKRIGILASREDHCLLDLLWRWRRGDVDGEVVRVISNYADHERDVESFGVPYDVVPSKPGGDAAAEQKMLELLAGNVELVVLARYMRILSDAFLSEIGAPLINIHHSFLPAFAGAEPYRRAHERGVKVIGATAHYVVEELDAGPIIEQDVARVSHRQNVDDLAAIGRDIERIVLARAVRWHLQDRIIVHENRTVVF
jgi:formyltetrahydrofolate deformylase